jgi:hypothetical protein
MPLLVNPQNGRLAIPCDHCGEHFYVWPSQSDRRHCSSRCRLAAGWTAGGDLGERFWPKVERRTWGECWLWQGALSSGYGKLFLGGTPRYTYAHRLAFFLTYGHWPLVGRHLCDIRRCCNPLHILDGTDADNRRDSVARGRHQHGATHWMGKLTVADVLAIRRRRDAGEPLKVIAADYGVTAPHVWMIADRRVWKHVPEAHA